MQPYEIARDAFDSILLELAQLADHHDEPALAGSCRREADRLRNGQLAVVVCGEFKVGKSSLVNALLDNTDLTPVDVDIATSTVLMIREGAEKRAFVVPADGGQPSPIAFEDIARFAAEGHRAALEATPKAVLIETPARMLEGGLTMIDTPGTGGLQRVHSEVAFAALTEADLVLFASDSQGPLTTNELGFIKDRILPLNRSLALVQTKADQQGDLSKVVEANRAKLRPLLSREPTIIAVSSHLKQAHLRSQDQRDLTESGFQSLEQHIDQVLRHGGRQRLVDRASQAVLATVDKFVEPRRAELMAINERGSPQFLALQNQIGTTKTRLQQLRNDHAHWRVRVSSEMAELRERAVQRGLRRALVEIETDFHAQAATTMASGDELHQVANELEQRVKYAFATTCREIAEGVETIRIKISSETGIPLSPIIRESTHEVRSAPPLQTGRTRGWMTWLGDWANQWRRQVVGGVTLGAIGGGLLGGAAGLLAGGVGVLPGFLAGVQIGGQVGALGGAVGGISSANKYVREKGMARARETLEVQLGPYLRIASTECIDSCLELIGALKDAMIQEFDQRIRDSLDDQQQREAALNRGLALEREAMVARKSQLIEELRAVEAVRDRAHAALNAFETAP